MMKITNLYVENFKSFGKLKVDFQPINLLIGANASGKSNVITLFEFLKKIQNQGIESAVSELGGFKRLLNFNANSRSFTIQVAFACADVFAPEEVTDGIEVFKKRTHILYKIIVSEKGNHFQIWEEITFTEVFVERRLGIEADETPLTSDIIYGVVNKHGKFETFKRSFTQSETLSNGKAFKLNVEDPFTARMLAQLNHEFKNRSILEYRDYFIPSYLFQFGIYDVQPNLAKQPNLHAQMGILDKDARNLTQVVNQILKEDPEIAEQFIASVGGVLDFVEGIKVDKFENVLTLKVREFNNKVFTDSTLISDGTIHVIALIVALYYQPIRKERPSISFFEELGKSMHPALLELLVERLYAHVEHAGTQLFITTHNADILKCFYERGGAKSIFLVERSPNSKYCTMIQPIAQKERVREFLTVLGIDELFIQDILK
jgi:predicted ATPase